MKIKISVELDGVDEWTDLDLGGQIAKQSHSYEIEFGEQSDQVKNLSMALVRAILAIDPPRVACLLAEMASDIHDMSDDAAGEAEADFYEAAYKLLRYYREHDDDLAKRIQAARNRQ